MDDLQTNSPIIREGNISDVASIANINREAWPSTYLNADYNILQSDITTGSPEDFAKITKRTESDILERPWAYFVAVADNKVVGYSCGRIYEDRDYNEFFAIYILPQYQGKGIGGMLAQSIFEYLGSDKPITLSVIGYNTKAIEFYKKLWFVFHRNLPDFELVTGKFVPEIELVRSVWKTK